MINPYIVLDIKSNATTDDIKSAFRSMALKHHPDVGGDWQSFIKIRNAYDKLTKTTETTMEMIDRLNVEMVKATKWVKSSADHNASFGNLEFEKHGDLLKITGRIMAGNMLFSYNIIMYGDISSPVLGTKHTMLSGKNIHVKGNVMNGAVVNAHDIFATNVVGLKRKIKDKIKVGVYHDISLKTVISAVGNVTLRDVSGPVNINGKIVNVFNLRDGCSVTAEHLIIHGNTITHDCTIHVYKSLKFLTKHILTLSDDCVITYPDGSIRLGRLKTCSLKKTGLNMKGTLVGSGLLITTNMMRDASKRRWNIFTN